MAKVPNGVETLPKISTGWVGCTNVTDDRRTDDDIANLNANVIKRHQKRSQCCSLSLNVKLLCEYCRYFRHYGSGNLRFQC